MKQVITLIITQDGDELNTRVEGMPSDVHLRIASPEQNVTMAERIALVAMDASINALEGYGVPDTDKII